MDVLDKEGDDKAVEGECNVVAGSWGLLVSQSLLVIIAAWYGRG